MREWALSLLLTLPAAHQAHAGAADDVDAALARVAALKDMRGGQSYSLPARGVPLSGPSSEFLGRRSPEEIIASGLSSGCGDRAAAFYGLLRAKGAELKYIQGVELSASSLLERFAGHTAVAVKDAANGRWLLVDPTRKRVLSADWDPASAVFRGPAGRFWIGYAGRLEDDPARSPAALKSSLRRMLRLVPASVWDEEVPALDFTADESLANPAAAAFLERFGQVYDDLGLRPRARIAVGLKDGGPGFGGDCRRAGPSAWECSVGRGAAMDQRWFSWVERRILGELAARD